MPWVLAFGPWTTDPAMRAKVAARLSQAGVARFGWLLLHTCQRVEILGAGPRPTLATLEDLTGVPAAHPAELLGDDAARHVLRLTAGLESAVVGEDQVLGQIRRLRRSADTTPTVPGRLVGLLDLAIHIGRRARAERPRAERGLADRGLAWLRTRLGSLEGSRLLVVGSGPIGREAAHLGRRAGASVIVATRSGRPTSNGPATVGRPPTSSAAVSLAEAARLLPTVDAAIVALAGPWTEVLDASLEAHRMARSFVVDLSAPAAVPGPVRAMVGGRLATLQDLVSAGAADDATSRAYASHAERLVEAALAGFARRAEPDLGVAIRILQDEAERRRATELERLLRRLPDLDEPEKAALDRFSRRLVSGALHAPVLALRAGR
jgi:glutamyl-tRNA reductase